MKRILAWGFIALAVWWVIQDPGSAATAVHHVGSLATKAATSFTTLISSI